MFFSRLLSVVPFFVINIALSCQVTTTSPVSSSYQHAILRRLVQELLFTRRTAVIDTGQPKGMENLFKSSWQALFAHLRTCALLLLSKKCFP